MRKSQTDLIRLAFLLSQNMLYNFSIAEITVFAEVFAAD